MTGPVRAALRAAVLCALVAGDARAQGAAADYERAAELRGRFADLLDPAPRPVWIDGARVWFEETGPDGAREFVVVDPTAAPELRRVSAPSSDLFGGARPVEIRPGATPRDLVAIIDSAPFAVPLRFPETGGIARVPGEVDGAALGRGALEAPRRGARSGRGRGAVTVVIQNASAAPVRLVWLDGDGKRRGYGEISPGESRSQGTFVGHLFALVDEEGNDVAHLRVPRKGGLHSYSAPLERTPRETGAMRMDVGFRDGALTVGQGDARRTLVESDRVLGTFTGPIEWAPGDGAFVCWLVRRVATREIHMVDSAPDDRLQPRLVSKRYRKPGDELDRRVPVLVSVPTDDPADARVVPIEGLDALAPNPWQIRGPRWRSDGSAFALTYNGRGHRVMRVLQVDAASGAVTTLVDEQPETFFDYSRKQYLTRLSPDADGSEDLVWMTERSGWNHLVRVDERTGEVTELTSGEWVVKEVRELDPEAREMLLVVCGIHPDQDPYHEHLARLDVDTGELTVLTEGDGTHDVEFSPSGEWFLDRWSRVDLAPVVELRSADGERSIELGRASTARLEAAGWHAPERFVAKGRDEETDIWGIVLRPTNFDVERSYPIVENIYAGPHDQHVPKSFAVHRKMNELAELGFIVVRVDGMGTNWRSKAFHDVAWMNLGDAGFPDRVLWLRALAAHEPAADLERVGIYGGSAGGQNAMRALIAHNDVYEVAVADCGCHDNRMDKIWWNELWMSWPIGDHYSESSNVDQAHRMEGELLLVVGELDTNVDPASTMQVVDALIRADKDFDLLVIPGAGHGAAETPYGTRRRRDFLVEHLWHLEPRRP